MKKIALLAVIGTLVSFTAPKKTQDTKTPKPKLVVGIVVDQMRYDYLTRYVSKFQEKGFKLLMNKGFNAKEHHFSYMPTYTGPGHASVFTGTTPKVHGIIANDWYDKELKRYVYCAEDTLVKSVGGDFENEIRSPKKLKVTTLADQIKLSTNGKGKTFGISMKDRGAILPAGKMADAAYWYKGGAEGLMISSTYYMNDLPSWVNEFNAQRLPHSYLSKTWKTLLPIEEYTESHPDNSPYEESLIPNREPVFPYDLIEAQKTHELSTLKEVPFGNDYLLDFALELLDKESLGQDESLDFLSISFSCPDYIGHAYGPNSVEVEDTYLRLDQNIATLLDYLNVSVGEGEYVLFLTADHGVAQVPQELIDKGVEVGYYSDSTLKANVNAALQAQYGSLDLIENYSNYQFFLNYEEIRKNKLDANEVANTILIESLKNSGVESGLIRNELATNSYTDRINKSVQKGWNVQRSGDVALVKSPGWLSNKYAGHGGTGHGSPWAYDTHVPFLLYGYGVKKGNIQKTTWVEDIVPTISAIIGVQPPMGCTGNPVKGAIK